MKSTFEQWFPTQSVSDEVKEIWLEAVTCFRVKSYRAAMIMSYIGFLSVVRERLLSASVPAGVPPAKWTDLQNSLKSDDKWDPAAFDATQTQQPGAYFLVPDSLRLEVKYWKDRRNDSAHNKGNKIDYTHVESFWHFVQSHLAKFVVNGSRPALLVKFKNHYDPSHTAPGTNVTPLVVEIAPAVLPIELDGFFSDLIAQLGASMPGIQPEISEVMDTVFSEYSPTHPVSASALKMLKQDPAALVAFMTQHPERVGLLVPDPVTMRKFWHDWMFQHGYWRLKVAARVLNAGVIPSNEVDGFLERLVADAKNEKPDATSLPMLEAAGYIDVFRRLVFIDSPALINQFSWGNPNADLAVWYLKNYPIDADVAAKIYHVFYSEPYPFKAKDALATFFASEPSKVQEYKSAASAAGVGSPSSIPALK